VRQALSDVSLVELSYEPAGSYAAKVFADLGADVVKVEPPGGDPWRRRGGGFVHLHTNKRSVVADPADADDRRWVDDLVGRADVVVQSPAQGDLAGYGLSVDAVRSRSPGTVVVSITGFGAEGPYAGYRWSDLVAQAAGWATLPMGRSEAVPVKMPGTVGLHGVGHTAAVGALAAVLRARASGAGAHVDCAAYEAMGIVPSRVGRYLGWEYRGHTPAPMMAAAGSSSSLVPIGVFPCDDGYVALMSTVQQLGEMLDVLGDDDLRAAFARPDAFLRGETKEILDAVLYPWLLSHTRAECTQAAQAAGWPFAPVNTPAEVLAADHLHQRAFWQEVDDPEHGRLLVPGPPYRFDEGGWRLRRRAPTCGEHTDEVRAETVASREPGERVVPAARRTPEVPPLDGVRVLDLTTVWSGPLVTQMLADLGAEVIRVENPWVLPPTTKGYEPWPTKTLELGNLLAGYAPPAAGLPDRPFNRHALNNSIARNKRSFTLDPRDAAQRELLLRLVERSDVFVENLKVSTLPQLGLNERMLLERNPRLIVLRIPPAGLSGDWAHYTGFGGQFDGLSGYSWLVGHPDTAIVDTVTTNYMDSATGPAGVFAVMAALHYRDATGRGQLVELAQLENVIAQLGDVYVDQQLGVDAVRAGNRDPWWAPQGIYPCTGEHRWLALTVDDDDAWAALTKVIGAPELADDPRFADATARLAHVDELDEILASWTRERDVLDAFHALQAAGVAAAPLLDDELVGADPNVAAREWVRPLTSRDAGTHPHIGYPYRGLPLVWWRGSPALGEDNEYVYREVLGLDADEYERLRERRIVVEDYLGFPGSPE